MCYAFYAMIYYTYLGYVGIATRLLLIVASSRVYLNYYSHNKLYTQVRIILYENFFRRIFIYCSTPQYPFAIARPYA